MNWYEKVLPLVIFAGMLAFAVLLIYDATGPRYWGWFIERLVQ